MNPEIVKARKEYLAKHPFDPRHRTQVVYDNDHLPEGVVVGPDVVQISTVAERFGCEFMAHVRTSSDMEAFLDAIKEYVGEDLRSFISVVLGSIEVVRHFVDDITKTVPGMNDHMVEACLSLWSESMEEGHE